MKSTMKLSKNTLTSFAMDAGQQEFHSMLSMLV